MHASPFIFSNERKWRLRRHISFWVAWWLFAGFIYSVGPLPVNMAYGTNLLRSLLESMAFLPLHIFLAYSLIYFIVPRYLVKGKYVLAVIFTLVAFAITALLSMIIGITTIPVIRSWFGAPSYEWFAVVQRLQILNGFMAGLRGGITIGGMAAAIKLMKYYYAKEQRNLQLQKEKAEAQLQLLKAQVHPHFLFNTLNNIFSHTQGSSPVASQLVMGLSDMLRYMLYEGNQALVPLSKELKMVQDYIYLEKIRYDDHLDVHIDIPGNTDNLYITPLLLLPLVENCFKHGTSNMLEQPWLSLHIHIEDTIMHMKLINGKPANITQRSEEHTGIGIKNVRTRLELLYPGKHILDITNDTDVFVVNLQLQLVRKTESKKKESSAFILSTHD
jgi:sensor histidine kinase YesM